VVNVIYKRGVSATSWKALTAYGTAVIAVATDRKCPYCAEMIKREARVCRFCGRDIEPASDDDADLLDALRGLHPDVYETAVAHMEALPNPPETPAAWLQELCRRIEAGSAPEVAASRIPLDWSLATAATPSPPERVLLRMTSARYAGGHPRLGSPHRGHFIVTSSRLGIGIVQLDVLDGSVKSFRFSTYVRFSSIASVDVIEGQGATSKVGDAVAVGAPGRAAKGSKSEATLAVHTTDGETAYFTIDKHSPTELRATLAPIFRKFDVNFPGGVDAESTSSSNEGVTAVDEA
jgi:hypothetical protein